MDGVAAEGNGFESQEGLAWKARTGFFFYKQWGAMEDFRAGEGKGAAACSECREVGWTQEVSGE